jgi:ATP-binding cassette subfamily B protein
MFGRGFKAYRQLQASDCGVTCVRMIARAFGKSIPAKALRSLTEVNKLGVSLQDLIDIFKKVGMRSTALRITVNDLYRMPLPAVLFWDQRHYVVLYRIDTKRKIFHIADPDDGKFRLSEDEFMSHWRGSDNTGVVVLAEPDDDFDSIRFDKQDVVPKLFNSVKSEIFRYKSVFIKVLILSLFCMGCDFLLPILLQNVVDKGIGERNIALVWMLIAGQVAVFLGNTAASNLVGYMMSRAGMLINLDMTRRYLERLVSFPLSFFDTRSSAELIQKTDDQSRIKDFLMQLPNSTLFVVLNLVVFSGIMIWYNVYLFLFFLALTLLEIGWTLLFLKPRQELDYAFFSVSSRNRNYMYELINGMKEIKVSGSHVSRLNGWVELQRRAINLYTKSLRLSITMSGGQSVIARLKEIAITGICATLVIDGKLSFGEMLTVGYVVGRLSGPFQSIIGMTSQLQDAAISYERLDEVLNDETEHKGRVEYSQPEIEFRNVGFRYAGNSSPFVIDGLNLKINKGETVALVGESGCGKTTLIKLMLGFYIPQRGEIRLSGIDIKDLDNDSWLENCGVVMQSGYIFSETIAENIAMTQDYNLDRVKEVVDIVGMRSFVESLPMRYDTRIGNTGQDLSGGQKQRLLIARAIYRNPEILFMDEATSSLDASNERSITERVNAMQSGKTLIVAAHRLSTVRNADRILFMSEGRILEEGTHEELIAKRGRYFELVNNQLEYLESME